MNLHHRAGSLAAPGRALALTPAAAGWTYCGLEVVDLQPGQPAVVDLTGREAAVLPLSAEGVRCTVDDETFELGGRPSVFARVTDFVYAPAGSRLTLTAPDGGQVAIPSATADGAAAHPARYGAAEDVAVEVRGAGPATRQVTNFLSPETWPYASKLMCVELLTPDGNWSSYPPHRHDDSPECPVNNEEIYYFRIGAAGTTLYSTAGFGLHRTYTPDGEIDEHVEVRDGDVFCVPRGYHGPCVAAPGYPMYYLNVLAGPGGERSMAFCDDPSHHWVRDTWATMPIDARCPMTDHHGVRS